MFVPHGCQKWWRIPQTSTCHGSTRIFRALCSAGRRRFIKRYYFGWWDVGFHFTPETQMQSLEWGEIPIHSEKNHGYHNGVLLAIDFMPIQCPISLCETLKKLRRSVQDRGTGKVVQGSAFASRQRWPSCCPRRNRTSRQIWLGHIYRPVLSV